MKIGLVLAGSPHYSETFFRSKIRMLHEAGHQVFLFTDKFTAAVPYCVQVPAYRLPSSAGPRMIKTFFVLLFQVVRRPRAVVRFFSRERSEHVGFSDCLRNLFRSCHIFRYRLDWLHFGFATLAVGRENVAWAIKAKMGVSFRGYDVCIYPLKYPGVYGKLWPKVDRVHTISHDLYKVALTLGLSPGVPVMKIAPAIEIHDFVSNGNVRPQWREGEICRIITVARLHWKKGLDDALRAMYLLKEQGLSFHYTIVGEGEEYEKLIYLRHIFGLDTEVEFVGKKRHEELPGLLRQAHVYLQPSVQEGFCNAVLEAQASGLLCVVSDAEGLGENICDGDTGWVVPKLDPVALANRIYSVIYMQETVKEKITARAISRVEKEFDLRRLKEEFVQFYN